MREIVKKRSSLCDIDPVVSLVRLQRRTSMRAATLSILSASSALASLSLSSALAADTPSTSLLSASAAATYAASVLSSSPRARSSPSRVLAVVSARQVTWPRLACSPTSCSCARSNLSSSVLRSACRSLPRWAAASSSAPPSAKDSSSGSCAEAPRSRCSRSSTSRASSLEIEEVLLSRSASTSRRLAVASPKDLSSRTIFCLRLCPRAFASAAKASSLSLSSASLPTRASSAHVWRRKSEMRSRASASF